MGAAFAKGFIEALINGLLEHDIPLSAIEFEADFAPYQPFKQKAVKNVKHLQFTNIHDDVANNKRLNSPFAVIEGNSEIFIDDNANKGHSIKDFYNQIINLPIGNYKIVNGVIVPQN